MQASKGVWQTFVCNHAMQIHPANTEVPGDTAGWLPQTAVARLLDRTPWFCSPRRSLLKMRGGLQRPFLLCTTSASSLRLSGHPQSNILHQAWPSHPVSAKPESCFRHSCVLPSSRPKGVANLRSNSNTAEITQRQNGVLNDHHVPCYDHTQPCVG